MTTRTLVIDDDPASLRLIEKYLSLSGYEVLTAANVDEALRIVLDQAPPIVITDYDMPDKNGADLCRILRQHEGVRFIYIVMMTASNDIGHLVEAFESGADDFVAKPVNPQELLARLRAGVRIARLEEDVDRRTREIHLLNAEMAKTNEQLALMNERLKKMAVTDELTGLPNRREAMNRLREMWAANERHGCAFGCIMIDLDRFKHINDTYGHAVGDQVLQDISHALRNGMRASDVVFRVGGEEFLVLCPHTEPAGTESCAEKLRQEIERLALNRAGRTLHVTISVGVAHRQPEMDAPDDLIRRADEALYAAKRGGRNRVICSKPEAMVQSGR